MNVFQLTIKYLKTSGLVHIYAKKITLAFELSCEILNFVLGSFKYILFS